MPAGAERDALRGVATAPSRHDPRSGAGIVERFRLAPKIAWPRDVLDLEGQLAPSALDLGGQLDPSGIPDLGGRLDPRKTLVARRC